jgi:hypothetical protein
MVDREQPPQSPREFARERALLAHEDTGIYVDANHLVYFGDGQKDIRRHLPLADIERIGPVRRTPMLSIGCLAMGIVLCSFATANELGVAWL